MAGQFWTSATILGTAAIAGLALHSLSPSTGGTVPAKEYPQRRIVAHASPTATIADSRGSPVGNGIATFTIHRAADSHFYADAQVNGAPVHFLVDTGASIVVLTPHDALNAGIGPGEYSASGVGAGGVVELMPAIAQRLTLGPLAADDVPVMVAKDGVPVSLLGQSYLSRFASISIDGDEMTLR